MRILMINSVCGILNTGRICAYMAAEYEKQGHEVKIAYGRSEPSERSSKYAVRIGTSVANYINCAKARLFDNEGFNAKRQTRAFLRWADEYDPDLLWLHNLHGYYINLELLFGWVKSRPNMEVRWLLHDCWAFTGHCSHCIQKRCYPKSFLKNNCSENYSRKKELFCGVKNMTLVTPSKWLADLVRQSFLKDYSIEVRYNTIDTNVFKPTPSDFRERHGLQDKKIVLGVASAWSKSKGLDDFVALSQMLDDSYAIVLVGLTRKQMKLMPQNVICLSKTNSTQELAEIYTAADVFVNPSKQETFGLTTVEAQACGTQPIVYKETACEEIVKRFGGEAVEQSPDAICHKIKQLGGGDMYIIYRTHNARELAAIYTAADVFLNLTYQDNYPTVNLEAQACGTPCITYRTGGSVESVPVENVVEQGDLNAVKDRLEIFFNSAYMRGAHC